MSNLANRCGYTHEDLAKRLGKSRTTVTESLALAQMPDSVRNLCRLADISSKSLLLQVVRQQTPEKMTQFVQHLTADAQSGANHRETYADAGAHVCELQFHFDLPSVAQW